MATESIFRNICIEDEESIINFINVLEQAKKSEEKSCDNYIDVKYTDVSKEDLKKILGKLV